MIPALMLWAWSLVGCSSPEPEGPTGSPEPAVPVQVPAARPAPATTAPVLYQRAVHTAHGVVSGVRLHADGVVMLAHADGPGGWVRAQKLPSSSVAAVQAELDTTIGSGLPATLPAAPNAPERAPSATYRFTTRDGDREVRSPTFGFYKVPAFDQVEAVLMRKLHDRIHHTTWTFHGPDAPPPIQVPCNPLDTSTLRPLAAKLRDGTLPPAPSTSGAPRLTVDWFIGAHTERTILGQDGTITRIDERGARTTYASSSGTTEALDRTIGSLTPGKLIGVCNGLSR